MSIPLGVVGQITSAGKRGHYVRVEDDGPNSGGLLVFEWWEDSDGPNVNGAFDSWVENKLALESFFQQANWVVKWPTA